MTRQSLGMRGEEFTCHWIERQGMLALERNYRAGKGEIDIIAQDRQDLVFIEVKTRSNLAFGTPGEAVTAKKRRMMIQTAQAYIMQNHREESNIRFDVAEVLAESQGMKLNYIKNAFGIENSEK
jgi:putative endonuclease